MLCNSRLIGLNLPGWLRNSCYVFKILGVCSPSPCPCRLTRLQDSHSIGISCRLSKPRAQSIACKKHNREQEPITYITHLLPPLSSPPLK